MGALEGFPRITPFLWFDANAEEAVEFYLTVFRNSRRIRDVSNTGDAPGPKGSILTIAFELDGQKFTALNGGLSSSSMNRSRLWCAATRNRRWTNTGRSLRRVAAKFSVAG